MHCVRLSGRLALIGFSFSIARRLMTYRPVTCLTIVIVLALPGITQAALFERDWKTPGDGLLTFDDVNNREWLDLSMSRLSQFPEPRLENAIAEIAPGGIFEGFTWAKRDEVRGLAESAGIDLSTTALSVNRDPVEETITLLGITLQSLGALRAVGFINEAQDPDLIPPPYDGAAFLINVNPATGGGYAGVFFSVNDDLLRPTANGLMLFRQIPEPASSPLIFVAIWILMLNNGRACDSR
jgi:hypothetical protein